MLRLSLRTLFSQTPSRSLSPYSILIPRCSTSPPHLNYPHSHSNPDPRNVRVSVWWDLDNCNVPSGVNVRGVQGITAAIGYCGIKGPIEINAFGDMVRLAKTTQEIQEALPSTAIQFSHIPPDPDANADGNYSAHSSRSLFNGLMRWVSRNPPPAHLFLIIADEGCASLVHQLRMKNYNILLASKKPAPTVLCTAATIIWNWHTLVVSEYGFISGRYINRLPNCPGYDQYDGPLEDPPDSPVDPEVLFSQDSFWKDMETFFNTEIGSFIIKESSDRIQMADWVEKYGPSVLKSLSERDLLRVVDRLISENYWLLGY